MNPRVLARWLACLTLLLLPFQGLAASHRICVYDPVGRVGDYFALLQDFSLEASTWGVAIELQPYTDEATAARDYEAGHCDGVLATGVRLQRLNNFPSTIEAIGALPTYPLLKEMIRTLATSEAASRKMLKGEHETVGIVPAGAVYFFVRDRRRDTVQELAGLRIATMDYDKASPAMVDRVGATRVPADLHSIGPRFNNGDADACYVSAAVYQPFELWRGLGTQGGIVRLTLAQATLQLMVRAPLYPAGFGARSRAWFLDQFDRALAPTLKAEAGIPAKSWIDLPASSMPDFDELFQSVRVQLRDAGAYDPMMLSVMRKLRCHATPSRAECGEQRE
jgi:hypothetical protein